MKKYLIFVLLVWCLVCVGMADATTYYVKKTCTYNGTGTARNCAASNGASGAFNEILPLKQAMENAGSSSDTVYIQGGQTYATAMLSWISMANDTFYGDWKGGSDDGRYDDYDPNHMAKIDTSLSKSSSDFSLSNGVYRAPLNMGDPFGSHGDPYVDEGSTLLNFVTTLNVTGHGGVWSVDNSTGSITRLYLGSSVGSLNSDEYYYDYDNNYLYINHNPSGKTIKILHNDDVYFTGVENWSSSTLTAFQAWFTGDGMANSGCEYGTYDRVHIFCPALEGIHAETLGTHVVNCSVHYSAGRGAFFFGESDMDMKDTIISNSRLDGFYQVDGPYGVALYNNTFYGNGGRGVWFDKNSEGYSIAAKNNISTNNGGDGFYSHNSLSASAISNNCNGGGTYGGGWSSIKGSNNVESDPQLISPSTGNFGILSDSPAAGAGVNVGLTKDYAGLTWPSPLGYDIGAMRMVYSVDPANGRCGSANGQTFTSAPATNLCSVGTPSAVTGSGPWIWTCQGTGGGVQCQANPTTWTVTGSVTGGNGRISCTSPVNSNLSSPCTISPSQGYRLGTLTDNGSDVKGQVAGNVYTIPSVTTNHVVTASFVASGAVIFWRNTSTGDNTLWNMDGSTHTGTAVLDPLPGPWRMVATADFNGDANADILWRNFTTGATMVWYMNGTTHTGSADLPAEADTNWRIVAAADFNGDRKPDILWRNISTGENRVWYMNGISRTGVAALTTVTDQNWRIAGAADFNHDGNADIIWRNSATGQNVVWYLEGISRTDFDILDAVTDQNWKMIVGTIDLNNDGKPDILWRNTSTGANMVWYMNGATHTGTASLDAVADHNMEMAGQSNN